MKASELITLLSKYITDYGDLPVNQEGLGGIDEPVCTVCVYDKNGTEACNEESGEPTEIYIH